MEEDGQIRIQVLLFARAAEIADARSVEFCFPTGSAIKDVRSRLVTDFPKLASLIQISRWALGNEFVEDDVILEESSEVAMIPPVSGG